MSWNVYLCIVLDRAGRRGDYWGKFRLWLVRRWFRMFVKTPSL